MSSQEHGSNLSGHTALVTGGAQGLGEAMVAALARNGAKVIIGDIAYEHTEQTAARFQAEKLDVTAVHLDVADEKAWTKAIEAIDGGFNILVNNAGVELADLITDVKVDEIRKMLDVNVLGTALGLKHGFNVMKPGGKSGTGGSIINIASVAATIAFPGISIYSACKSAIDRMTRVSAAEGGKLGYGIRVNCIYPGLVPTAMGAKLAEECAQLGLFDSPQAAVAAVESLTPLGRLGTPEDMAATVVFLASDASGFITGAGIPVDGGMGS